MTDSSLKSQFDKELSSVPNNVVFSAEYRRKKATLHLIRTAIAAILYLIFWKYSWVRWSLVLYVPLNVFALLSIFGWNYFLKRKIQKNKKTN